MKMAPRRAARSHRRLIAGLCAFGLLAALVVQPQHDARAQPSVPDGLPGIEEVAGPLGLSPDDVADLIPAPALSGGRSLGASATEASGSGATYLPLALRRSGPLPPPVMPTASPTPAPTPTPVDETAAMFDPDAVLDVRIEMDPNDWDALRVQARTMADLFSDDECMSEPRVSPFTYFPADVRVNGDLITNVGVRKKGFLGSVSSAKPSLKISFDEYVDRPRHAGLNRLTLNNGKQDKSLLRQCLTYGLFAEAGLPAPRCNFARVTVNGRYLGVYAHVESIKKPFLERAFGDDSGNLYEGTLSDFTVDWAGTFERKTNESDADRSDISALVSALEADDAELLDALAPVLDIDAFLDYWALEVLTGHWDGYTNNRNNFYFYHDPASERFAFIPWGTDGAFVNNFRRTANGGPPLASVTATAHLPRRLYLHPEGRERYFSRLEALLDEMWHEASIIAEINRMADLIEPELERSAVPAFRRDVSALRSFVNARRPAIQAELRNGRPDREIPQAGPPCRRAVGHFDGTFAVRWAQPGVITATASVQLAGIDVALDQVGAFASRSDEDPWPTHVAIQMSGVAPQDAPPIWKQGDAFIIILYVAPEQFAEDRVVKIDGRNAFAWAVLSVLQRNGSRQTGFLGMLWDGELTLDAAGTVWGSRVSGTMDTDIVVWGGL